MSVTALDNPTIIPESRLSRRTHAAGAALAIIGLGAANAVLNRLYQASGHPVDYATGQLSFSASRIKGWYADMQAGGTLDVYVATQLFDFVFILTVFATGALAATYLARVNVSARGRGSALWAAAALSCGAAFDVLENLVSFAMLASSQGFPEPLAWVYSTMAVAKFALMGTGVALLLFSLVLGALSWARGFRAPAVCSPVAG